MKNYSKLRLILKVNGRIFKEANSFIEHLFKEIEIELFISAHSEG